MLVDLQYKAGTIKNPQHTKLTEAAFTETDKVHFPDGILRNIHSYDTLFAGDFEIKGQCRQIWASKLSGTNAGTYYFLGTHSHLYVYFRSVYYNITPLKTVSEAVVNDGVTTVNGSNVINIEITAHNLVAGDRIKIEGAASTGGIDAGEINAEHIITSIVDVNNITVTVASSATADATGGGSAIVFYRQIDSGFAFQGNASGYGAGVYGAGVYGAPATSTIEQNFPRIWSFDDFGNEVIMCAGDYRAGDGQKIYIWDGNTSIAPTVLANAPTDCNWVSVVNNSVIAFCDDGTERRIDISELGNATVWTGQTTTSLPLQRSYKILSAFTFEEKSAVVFTPEPLLLRFVGGAWDLSDISVNAPIIAPMACCPLNDGLVWYGQDNNFHYFDGGSVAKIENMQNGEYIAQQINNGAIWTAFMATDREYNQVWFHFPCDVAQSPDAYVIWNPKFESFTLGMLSRSAAQRPAVMDSLFIMMDGSVPHKHYIRASAKHQITATMADMWIDDGKSRGVINQILPDIFQENTSYIGILTKEHPNQPAQSYGTYPVENGGGEITTTAAGKLVSFKFTGTGEYTLGGMKIDVQAQGGRW